MTQEQLRALGLHYHGAKLWLEGARHNLAIQKDVWRGRGRTPRWYVTAAFSQHSGARGAALAVFKTRKAATACVVALRLLAASEPS